MQDLGIDLDSIADWFQVHAQTPYTLVKVPDAQAQAWSETLGLAVRRCYIDDKTLSDAAASSGLTEPDVIAARLPSPGSVMSGDFGEILVLIYQAASEPELELMAPMRWRLKQDRTKPAPKSDVVHFHIPNWPTPTADDRIYCAEVKAKATAGASAPIASAIADCERDRTSRLANTLVWLRERSIFGDLGSVSTAHLDRFINATEFPPAEKRFSAIAVVCESLLADELLAAPIEQPTEYTLVVIGVPGLKQRYEEVFAAAANAVNSADAE